MAVKNTDNDVAEELSDQQLDCARLLATAPDRSKKEVAASLQINPRTIFRWINDERFQEKIKEFKRAGIVASDAKGVLGMLSAKQRKELLSLLLAEKDHRHLNLPEIASLENRMVQIAENDDDPLQEKTKSAVRKVELLLGRLRRNALCSMDYEPDGSPVKQTLREFVDDLMETAVIAARLGEDKLLVRAVAEAWSLIGQQMGEEQRQHPEPEWDRKDTNNDEEPEEDYADEWDEAEDESHEIDGGPKEWED